MVLIRGVVAIITKSNGTINLIIMIQKSQRLILMDIWVFNYAIKSKGINTCLLLFGMVIWGEHEMMMQIAELRGKTTWEKLVDVWREVITFLCGIYFYVSMTKCCQFDWST